MRQGTLFELDAEAVACPKAETANALSQKRDRERCRHLVSLAARVQRTADPIERACLATAAREAADALVDASITEANRAGITWRDIGARLGIPFQTLHRRYGAGGPSHPGPTIGARPLASRRSLGLGKDPDIEGDA